MERTFSVKRVVTAVFVVLMLFFVLVIGYFAGIPNLVERKIDEYSRYSFRNILIGGDFCIKEGERGNAFFDKGIDCCPGLKNSGIWSVVNENAVNYSERCAFDLGGGFICLNCGNKICEPDENLCNCEQDCSRLIEE